MGEQITEGKYQSPILWTILSTGDWRKKRMEDLSEAIHKYIKEGKLTEISDWYNELGQLIEEVGK